MLCQAGRRFAGHVSVKNQSSGPHVRQAVTRAAGIFANRRTGGGNSTCSRWIADPPSSVSERGDGLMRHPHCAQRALLWMPAGVSRGFVRTLQGPAQIPPTVNTISSQGGRCHRRDTGKLGGIRRTTYFLWLHGPCWRLGCGECTSQLSTIAGSRRLRRIGATWARASRTRRRNRVTSNCGTRRT